MINNKSEFVLVCYDKYGKPYNHPAFKRHVYRIQSFPIEKTRALKALVKLAKKVPLGLIYTQKDNILIRRFENGIEVPPEVKTKYVFFYGKDISALAMMVYLKPERILEVEPKYVFKVNNVFKSKIYSDVRVDETGEEASYWWLVNNFLKGKFRGKYTVATIYNRTNEQIGKYIGASGRGKYHQQNFF